MILVMANNSNLILTALWSTSRVVAYLTCSKNTEKICVGITRKQTFNRNIKPDEYDTVGGITVYVIQYIAVS
jgi:hypothetical protein